MKNKKAICALILAAIVMVLAVLFKDSTPRLVHYSGCILAVILAWIAVIIEKR